MTHRRAFVTGGCGFLGLNLVKNLLEDGWQVTIFDRDSSGLRYLGPGDVTFVAGSTADTDAIQCAMPDHVDVVFHVAGNISFDARDREQQVRDNVDGTRNVVEASLAARAGRFVHTSSMVVYGLHDGRIREDTPPNGLSQPYGYFRTKALAEAEVRKGLENGLDAVILNPANIIGAYDRGGWARMIGLVHLGRLRGVGPAKASFCHASEVAAAHVAAAETGKRGHNYLLGGTDASYFELAHTIRDVVGGRAPRWAMPEILLRLAGIIDPCISALRRQVPTVTPDIANFFSRDMLVDSTRAETELGYRPVPLRLMVEDAANWLRQEGLLNNWRR